MLSRSVLRSGTTGYNEKAVVFRRRGGRGCRTFGEFILFGKLYGFVSGVSRVSKMMRSSVAGMLGSSGCGLIK